MVPSGTFVHRPVLSGKSVKTAAINTPVPLLEALRPELNALPDVRGGLIGTIPGGALGSEACHAPELDAIGKFTARISTLASSQSTTAVGKVATAIGGLGRAPRDKVLLFMERLEQHRIAVTGVPQDVIAGFGDALGGAAAARCAVG